jgi:hypothetical protein
MKRQMFFATAFSAALAVSAAAQTGTAQPPSQERSQGQQVTVTGCLAQAPSSATGTSGTAGTSASGAEFILRNATMGSGSASGSGSTGTASGTAGTSASGSASAMGKSYKLIGGTTTDLKEHLNAKVEVRGTIDRAGASGSGSATGTGTGTGTASGTSASQSDKDMQTLRVTSVRKIADSCQ